MGETLLKNEEVVSLLTKEQLTQFLGLTQSRQLSKGRLVEQLVSLIEADAAEMARFLETYKSTLAFGPWDVERILGCTGTERKRWTADGKLPILGYREFRKAARDIPYPVFDRREILSIPPERVEQWRTEHQSLVKLRRATGAKIAAASRKAHHHARAAASTTWETMVAVWTSQGSPELAAVLRLAYWAGWMSRLAKTNREKMQRAIKYRERYAAHEQNWYHWKNTAFHLLLQTPYAHLSFYRPEDPDKISLSLCDEHNEERREMHMSKWEYYDLFGASVRRCPECIVDRDKDYYSLYFLEITTDAFPGLRFAFHTPYPIGKKMRFPKPGKLPRVDHSDAEQEEGLFRFGRSLLDEEKVIYREQDVQGHVEEALATFHTFYPQKEGLAVEYDLLPASQQSTTNVEEDDDREEEEDDDWEEEEDDEYLALSPPTLQKNSNIPHACPLCHTAIQSTGVERANHWQHAHPETDLTWRHLSWILGKGKGSPPPIAPDYRGPSPHPATQGQRYWRLESILRMLGKQ
jgi:hypothetical protein